MEDSRFDVIILGTGLTESIVAAALSKWGFRVAHIDQNPYYGGNEASLTLDEFAKWIDTLPLDSSRFSHATRSSDVPSFARQYSICLCPTIIPSTGPFIEALIQSGVSKYSGFRLLEHVAVYDGVGSFKSVPGSKEDVFRNKDITLIQKRRLMRFLTFAVGDLEQSLELQGKHDLPFTEFLETVFSLNKELVDVITYALGYSNKPTDSTITVLSRIRRYLRSVGRYGPSPFLVGHYGGVGEISQGFCRVAAVNGAVYILGRKIVSVSAEATPTQPTDGQPGETDSPKDHYPYSVCLEDIPEPLYARAIISSNSYMPNQLSSYGRRTRFPSTLEAAHAPMSIARCVAIAENPILLHPPSQEEYLEEEDDEGREREESEPKADKTIDTAVLVFPPASLDAGSSESSAVVVMTGEGTLSSPKGKYILYVGLPVAKNEAIDPSQILRPYLDTILKLGREVAQEPLFTAFYIETLDDITPHMANDSQYDNQKSWLILPSLPLGPPGDVADAAAQNAEIIFREALGILDYNEEQYNRGDAQNDGIWPQLVAADEGEL